MLANWNGPFSNILVWKNLLLMLLIAMVLFISINIVYVKHSCRNKFNVLQNINRQQRQLHVEWQQLLLEKGTLAATNRVEKIAKEKLDMISPKVILQIKP